MKKFLSQLAVALMCALLGFVMVTQVRSVRANAKAQEPVDPSAARADELQVLLTQEEEKTAALTLELEEYKAMIESYRQEASSSGDYNAALTDELNRAEMIAGLTDLSGPGVIVTMKDSPSADVPENEALIHDDDILKVINELRDAGAEAISINDERILATSEIRCSGATVSVNNKRYSAPYVIKAIGDSKNLENALTMRYGVVEVLQSWNIDVTVVRSNQININGYDGIISFTYAKEVE